MGTVRVMSRYHNILASLGGPLKAHQWKSRLEQWSHADISQVAESLSHGKFWVTEVS